MKEANLEKVYDPKAVEEKWMTRWEEEKLFHAGSQSDQPPFSIVIPPPNVTGSLHLGHALNSTLQDILARWQRMSGKNVLWLPGMDHAGIATQNVVERQLAKDGQGRHDLGRAAFIERIWEWKAQSGGSILKQLKRLGASCDWSRERFTMDEGLSRAVQTVFVRLHQEGLIHRDKRLINLCPHCRTALSDIEVEHEDLQGQLYTLRYPLAEDPKKELTVATTRPETMLADTAVAVHPEDPRFNQWIGKKVTLPLTNREIPIIGDPILVDQAFGTGAVKITPGHDFNDEKSGKRHQLGKYSLIGWDGKIHRAALLEAEVESDLVQELDQQTMLAARKIILEKLDKAGVLVQTEEHLMSLGKCYRCKTVVEPFDSPQWFVKVNEPGCSLAQEAVDAVRQKKIRLIPESWAPNYFGWMENIEDWCISRQIWWGHQIPVWYCKSCDHGHILKTGSGDTMIAEHATPIVGERTCQSCGGEDLIQDPDVLDTWFSSALWPFSTLGWPADVQLDEAGQKEAQALLKQFYPTSVLVSAFDILFFWIARMIMMGLHFMKEVPFRDVYIHALVRDAEGQKMSKSKGNVINPLDLMDRYGTDALRFTLASMASPGRDIKLSEDRIEGYRNFCNKLWNAARFIQMNRPEKINPSPPSEGDGLQGVCNRWIQSRLNETVQSVDVSLQNYRFDEAAQAIYQFTWHTYCDWYLELAKVDLQNEATREESYSTMTAVFERILRLLHPMMPFMTEELWTHFQKGPGFIAVAPYPKYHAGRRDISAEDVVQEVVIATILAVRHVRGEMNIPPSEQLQVFINVEDKKVQAAFEAQKTYLQRLARLSEVSIGVGIEKPPMSATAKTGRCELYLPLDEVRIRDEIERLKKRQDKVIKSLEILEKKLANPKFTANAPVEVVEKTKTEQEQFREEQTRFITEIEHLQHLLSGESGRT